MPCGPGLDDKPGAMMAGRGTAFNLTGKPSTNFIDAPWVCTHVSNPEADTAEPTAGDAAQRQARYPRRRAVPHAPGPHARRRGAVVPCNGAPAARGRPRRRVRRGYAAPDCVHKHHVATAFAPR